MSVMVLFYVTPIIITIMTLFQYLFHARIHVCFCMVSIFASVRFWPNTMDSLDYIIIVRGFDRN